MELKEGDVIAFMDELEEGWWRGMKLGNQGQVNENQLSYMFFINVLIGKNKKIGIFVYLIFFFVILGWCLS